MSIEKQKILDVKAKIETSDLREAHKDAITDMLDRVGNATNGVLDKTQALTEAIAGLGVCFARDALYRREDFRDLMDESLTKHRQDCPLSQKWDGETERRGRDGVSVGGKGWRVNFPVAITGLVCVTVIFVGVVATIWKAKGWA